jgi:beta-glucanase (GH16 family)
MKVMRTYFLSLIAAVFLVGCTSSFSAKKFTSASAASEDSQSLAHGTPAPSVAVTPPSSAVLPGHVTVPSPPAPADSGSSSSNSSSSSTSVSIDLWAPSVNQNFAPEFWTTLSSQITTSAGSIVKVEYFVSGQSVCVAPLNAPYNCSYKTPSQAGSYNLTVQATNSYGAVSTKQIIFTISSGASSGYTATTTPVLSPVGGQTAVAPDGYSIAFDDEFNNNFNGAPNPAYWDYDVDANINNELQCYTENRRDNVRVENRTVDNVSDGVLVLQLRKESYPCAYAGNRTFSYTSGGIQSRTKGWGAFKVDMSFGRYEIRAKLPSGRGTWPAIWLLGDSALGSWPNSGEIDIMEQVGYDEANGVNRFYSTIHKNISLGGAWPTQTGSDGLGHSLDIDEAPSKSWHVFALDWTPSSLTFYVDGKIVGTRTIAWDQTFQYYDSMVRSQLAPQGTAMSWPFGRDTPGHQFDMILNLAWGGGWGGATGVDDRIFDQGAVEMLVDYVRVYRKN